MPQFQMYQQQAGELPWPMGMVDECDMDIDIDLSAEVRHWSTRCSLGRSLPTHMCIYAPIELPSAGLGGTCHIVSCRG